MLCFIECGRVQLERQHEGSSKYTIELLLTIVFYRRLKLNYLERVQKANYDVRCLFENNRVHTKRFLSRACTTNVYE